MKKHPTPSPTLVPAPLAREHDDERPRSRAEREYDEDSEGAAFRASSTLALLQCWAEANASHDPGGRDIELEQDAWYAVETLLSEARAVLNCLNKHLGEAVQATRTDGAR